MKTHKHSGFTLAELLIVVAVISVLVAIAIPIFSSQLEKSREATDLANVRAAYAEVIAAAISEDQNVEFYNEEQETWSITTDLVQTRDGWTSHVPLTIGGVESGNDGGSNGAGTWIGMPKALGTCEVSYSLESGVVIVWDGDRGPVSGDTDNSGTLPNEQESSMPEKSESDKIPDGFDGAVHAFPVEASGFPFECVKGSIYSYQGNLYVADRDVTANKESNDYPGHSNLSRFIDITSATILTQDEMKELISHQTSIDRGTIVLFEGEYYVCEQPNNHADNPPVQTYAWIKLNTEPVNP